MSLPYIRSSENHLWCTASVLGEGTFGIVFKGVSKHDGEPVAVKTFNHRSPEEAQLREFEMLKKVNHENVVKLLAIEEETYLREKVIIMELCTGGSLHTLLDDPEYSYGFPEDDFLLVLAHLSAGMKHLRDNNIVHRDLKPGNIMKFTAEDGQIIFKLVDFGAARELEEGQEFLSLYGTEEYCHPDMYERVILGKPVSMGGKKTFSASVDLWSIGVTLYHVATGSLPFTPYGGRKNKEMMHFIATQKESGVIAGCQLTENGLIEWKRELPTTCQISNGLKHLITPLLAGLMEVDESKRWTYDVFFDAFSLNSTTPCEILQTFQKLIQDQTEITPENQITLHKEGNLAQAQFKFVVSQTSEDNPVILCDKENVNVVFNWDIQDLQEFPILPNHGNINLENDATLGKLSCAVGYSYKRKIEEICLQVHLITVAVEAIMSVISQGLTSVPKDSCAKIQIGVRAIGQLSLFMEKTQKTVLSRKELMKGRISAPVCVSGAKDQSQSNRAEDSSLTISANNFNAALQELEGRLQARLDSMKKTSNAQSQFFKRIQQRTESLEQRISNFQSSYVQKQPLMVEWRERALDIRLKNQSQNLLVSVSSSLLRPGKSQGENESQIEINPNSNSNFTSTLGKYNLSSAASCIFRAGKKAQTQVEKLRESWEHLLRDKTARSLTCYSEQLHNLERIKMQAKSKCLSEILNEECQPGILSLTEMLATFYTQAHAALLQTDIIAKDTILLEKIVLEFLPVMDGIRKDFQTDMEFVTRALKEGQDLWRKRQEDLLKNASNSHLNPALNSKMKRVLSWLVASGDQLQLRGRGQGRTACRSKKGSARMEKHSVGASTRGLRICPPCRNKCGPCLRRGCRLAQSAPRVPGSGPFPVLVYSGGEKMLLDLSDDCGHGRSRRRGFGPSSTGSSEASSTD